MKTACCHRFRLRAKAAEGLARAERVVRRAALVLPI